MQFKNKLLSGVIASAVILGATGQAYAVDVNSVRIALTTVLNPTAPAAVPFQFANEVTSADGSGSTSTNGRDDGVAAIEFEVETGTFPSGNVIMQLQLNGGTFDGALTAAIFDFVPCGAAPTANVSIGGADGGNTVTFLLSNLNGCAPGEAPVMYLPFDVNSPTSDVSLIMTILTESGTVPVDNTLNQVIPLVEMASAFDVDINDSPPDSIADVEADEGPYLNFIGGVPLQTLGDVQVVVDPTVFTNFGVTARALPLPAVVGVAATPAAVGDLNDVTVTVSGALAAFTDAPGLTALGAADLTDNINAAGTSVTAFYDTAGTVDGLNATIAGGAQNFQVTADLETPIVASPYTVSVLVDMDTTFNDFTVGGAFSSIVRNGSFAILPWTASNTQAAGTGSNNFVRISNPTGDTYGPIFATVLAANSTGAALVGDTVTLAPSLAAGGEVVFTAADLESLIGNFGRADIEIAVEGQDALIVRLIQRTDGTYEINNQ